MLPYISLMRHEKAVIKILFKNLSKNEKKGESMIFWGELLFEFVFLEIES